MEAKKENLKSVGKTRVTMWTDGAVYKNGQFGSVGGWGVILESNGHRKEMLGGVDSEEAGMVITNQRMELLAPIMGLQALKKNCHVTIITDSKYVQNGFTYWVNGWVKNGWKNKQGKTVSHRDLWEKFLSFKDRHNIDIEWVKGHNGHDNNERADELATEGKQAVLDGRRSARTRSTATYIPKEA